MGVIVTLKGCVRHGPSLVLESLEKPKFQTGVTYMSPSARPNEKRPLAGLAKWPFLMDSLVGIAGFEPTTSASRRQRSTKLSYIPNVAEARSTTGRIIRRRRAFFKPLFSSRVSPFFPACHRHSPPEEVNKSGIRASASGALLQRG